MYATELGTIAWERDASMGGGTHPWAGTLDLGLVRCQLLPRAIIVDTVFENVCILI